MNELIKKKISYSLKGRRKSASTKKRISQSLKGRKLSDVHKKKISQAMKRKAALSSPYTFFAVIAYNNLLIINCFKKI